MTAAACMTALVLTAGCTGAMDDDEAVTPSSSSSATSTAGSSVQRAGGSVALISAEVDGVMEALLTGVIVRSEHGCLSLTDGSLTVPALWPHGSVLSEDGLSVVVPDLGTVTVGDEVWAGGGNITLDSSHPILRTLPEECTPPPGASIAALQTLLEGPPADVPTVS